LTARRERTVASLKRPLLAVTMGDPAGIGAEVTLKALHILRRESFLPLLIGDFGHLSACARRFKVPLPLVRSQGPEGARRVGPRVGVLDLGGAKNMKWGRVSAPCGAAAVSYVKKGAWLALEGKVDALVTAPIQKEAIHKAGCPFPGHTELLAHLSGSRSFAMMMVGGPFRIVLQSIHVSLKDSLKSVRRDLVRERLGLTHRALARWFGIPRPRIAVAGVNPHAGEGGAFGQEEIAVLLPEIRRATRKGWRVSGPHPPDTLFHRAAKGAYDAVLCMYHDQGLIPLKLLAFEEGVNLTLGLPFVRTSPDHGTAFDIAGKGRADASSMVAALRLAARLAGKS